MKIQEVEELVGISKKNIRFYEKEGLLTPKRNLENGYRYYSQEDVLELKKIKLLRRLAIPIEEIRKIQTLNLTLEDALGRHFVTIEREKSNLENILLFCDKMIEENVHYPLLNADQYLEKMEESERKGMRFMNILEKDKNKKKIAPIIATIVVTLFMVWTIGILIWAQMVEPIPLIFIGFFILIPVVMIIGIFVVLRQRMKEIEGGEEDAASKY
ncbi:MAG: MerR family transcriptional regulator [Lachnospiraceae bacterium]